MENVKRLVPCAVTGDDDKSHWSSVELTLVGVDPDEHGGGSFFGHSFGVQELALVEFPAGFTCDFHQGIRSVIMVMKGRVRFELNDGTAEEMGPGDVAMFHDDSGGGHRALALDGAGVTLAVGGMEV